MTNELASALALLLMEIERRGVDVGVAADQAVVVLEKHSPGAQARTAAMLGQSYRRDGLEVRSGRRSRSNPMSGRKRR